VQAIEVKSGMTVQPGMLRSLKNAMALGKKINVKVGLYIVETRAVTCMEMSSCLTHDLLLSLSVLGGDTVSPIDFA
jgi:hypothetical protein